MLNRWAARRPLLLAHLLLPASGHLEWQDPSLDLDSGMQDTQLLAGHPAGQQRLTRPKWGILLGSNRVGGGSVVVWDQDGDREESDYK